MYVAISDTQRIHVRPLWQAFLLSLVTGSLYQLYWACVTARELGAARITNRSRIIAWPAALLASEALVLWAAVAGPGTTLQWTAVTVGCAIGCWAAFELSADVARMQDRASITSDAWYRARPIVSCVLLAAALGIGAAGVQPGDPKLLGGEVLDPFQRAFEAWATGLLLPTWLLYLQHGLNQALLRMNPMTQATETFGSLSGMNTAQAAVFRARLAEHHGSSEASEELNVLPRVTLSVAALCTLVFAWQVISFGFALSLSDMRHSGASSIDLVHHGDWWRLATQHVVHFSVDHWAFNMFALLLGGWMLERVVGHRVTAAVVIGSAIGATLLTWFVGPALYGHAGDAMLGGGESGIGFGVIGALVAVDPGVRTPAGRFARWMMIIGGISSLAPGIAILAHAGGFAGGAAAVLIARTLKVQQPEVVYEGPHAATTTPIPPRAFGAPPAVATPPPSVAPWEHDHRNG